MTDPFGEYYSGLLTIVQSYKEDKSLLYEMIKKFDSPVTILSAVYMFLIHRKEIAPLESLPAQQKNKLWSEAQILPKKRQLMYCRAKYLLSVI